MNKKEIIINIKDGFDRLSYAINNITWTKYANDLYRMEKEYEKKHRDFTNCNYVFSQNLCAKYWAVHHILEALDKKTKYDIKSYLHIKKSVFFAHSLVANYKEEIEKEFLDFDRDAFDKIDITEWKEVA